uniref:Uncharacterized protein n=1 Tax=Glossina pallidipes TaxID=7398 RepID=A0A1A9ZWJ7_GLOPL
MPETLSIVDQRRATIVPLHQQRQPEDDVSDDKASTCGTVLIFLSVVLVILTLPFSLFVCFKNKVDFTQHSHVNA